MTDRDGAEFREVRLADACLAALHAGPKSLEVVKPDRDQRFDLFHADFSLCSHKVRAVLAHKSAGYRSVPLTLMPSPTHRPQNYIPEYVRLRMASAQAGAERFVNGFDGSSSVRTQGFDPCVVPTLVDRERSIVVTDSLAICCYLDDVTAGTPLVPDAYRDQVHRHLDLQDDTPHVALLYGALPGGDPRPGPMKQIVYDVHARKIADLELRISENADDSALVAAYRAKIDKETAAADYVATAEAMRGAFARTAAILDVLEADLAVSDNWLTGPSITLADLGWGVSLFRLVWLGHGPTLIDRCPRVRRYSERLFAVPSLRASVIDWPGLPRSPHVEGHAGIGGRQLP